MVEVELRSSPSGDYNQKWIQKFFGTSHCRGHSRKVLTQEAPPAATDQLLRSTHHTHQTLVLIVQRPVCGSCWLVSPQRVVILRGGKGRDGQHQHDKIINENIEDLDDPIIQAT